MGILKSLFGKPKANENPYEGLSEKVLNEKLAERNAKISELKRLLPTEAVLKGLEKSAAWREEMETQYRNARNKGEQLEVARLAGELADAEKKQEKIASHVAEINARIETEEIEIELIERALENVA